MIYRSRAKIKRPSYRQLWSWRMMNAMRARTPGFTAAAIELYLRIHREYGPTDPDRMVKDTTLTHLSEG